MRAPALALAALLTLVACAPEEEPAQDPPTAEAPSAEAGPPIAVAIEEVCLPDQGIAGGRVVPDTVRAPSGAVVNWALSGNARTTAWGFALTPKAGTYWPDRDSIIVGDRSTNGSGARMTVPSRGPNAPDSVITYQVTVFCLSGETRIIDPDIIIGQDTGGSSPDSVIRPDSAG